MESICFTGEEPEGPRGRVTCVRSEDVLPSFTLSGLDPNISSFYLIVSLTRGCTWGCGKSLESCLTLCDPVDYNPPGCSAHGFPRQEYWSGLPCSSPRDLPDPGTEPTSLMSPALAGRFFTTSALGDNEMTRKYENLTFSQEKQQENP